METFVKIFVPGGVTVEVELPPQLFNSSATERSKLPNPNSPRNLENPMIFMIGVFSSVDSGNRALSAGLPSICETHLNRRLCYINPELSNKFRFHEVRKIRA